MVKTITDSGYCFGVLRAIETAREAAKPGKDVYLAHLLMHNLEESARISKECGIKPLSEMEPPYEGKTVVFSAHGHSPEEEKYPGAEYIDGICPFIAGRYRNIKKYEALGYPIVYCGKKGHQETIGFTGIFANSIFIDQNDLDGISLPLEPGSSIVAAVQTTLSKTKSEKLKNWLSENYEIVAFFDICPTYKKRFHQAYDFLIKLKDLKNVSVIVAGDSLSSNAHETAAFLQTAFKDLDVRISLSLSPEEMSYLKKRDVFIVSSTSASRKQVERLEKALAD